MRCSFPARTSMDGRPTDGDTGCQRGSDQLLAARTTACEQPQADAGRGSAAPGRGDRTAQQCRVREPETEATRFLGSATVGSTVCQAAVGGECAAVNGWLTAANTSRHVRIPKLHGG